MNIFERALWRYLLVYNFLCVAISSRKFMILHEVLFVVDFPPHCLFAVPVPLLQKLRWNKNMLAGSENFNSYKHSHPHTKVKFVNPLLIQVCYHVVEEWLFTRIMNTANVRWLVYSWREGFPCCKNEGKKLCWWLNFNTNSIFWAFGSQKQFPIVPGSVNGSSLFMFLIISWSFKRRNCLLEWLH